MKYIVMSTVMNEIPEDGGNDVYGCFVDSYEYESSEYFYSLSEANQCAARHNFLLSKYPDSISYYWVKEIEE